jgi:hypothetical protein
MRGEGWNGSQMKWGGMGTTSVVKMGERGERSKVRRWGVLCGVCAKNSRREEDGEG